MRPSYIGGERSALCAIGVISKPVICTRRASDIRTTTLRWCCARWSTSASTESTPSTWPIRRTTSSCSCFPPRVRSLSVSSNVGGSRPTRTRRTWSGSSTACGAPTRPAHSRTCTRRDSHPFIRTTGVCPRPFFPSALMYRPSCAMTKRTCRPSSTGCWPIMSD